MRDPRIAILSSGAGWHVQDLERAAASLGIAADRLDFRALEAGAGCGSERRDLPLAGGGRDLLQYDAVLVRTLPAGSLEQVVFRMDALHALEAAGVPVINPPRALETAIDKYLALVRMARQGLPVPRTRVCESPARALQAFDELGGDAVVKPIFGSEGRGVIRISSRDEARQALEERAAGGGVLYLQEFIDHGGNDTRVLVVGERAAAGMVRRAPDGSWVTNIARGGRPEPLEVDAPTRELALAAARAVGAEVAGVDILRSPSGRDFVLEVNAVPGWRALAAVSGIDIAAEVLRHLLDRSRARRGLEPERLVR